MATSKNQARLRRKIRIRKKVAGNTERPRLVVFRSNTHIYAQIVDDSHGATLVSASSLAMKGQDEKVHGNVKGATEVGREIARRAKEKNITRVVFDRNGYIYHGRVKALAEGAREEGLEF